MQACTVVIRTVDVTWEVHERIVVGDAVLYNTRNKRSVNDLFHSFGEVRSGRVWNVLFLYVVIVSDIYFVRLTFYESVHKLYSYYSAPIIDIWMTGKTDPYYPDMSFFFLLGFPA